MEGFKAPFEVLFKAPFQELDASLHFRSRSPSNPLKPMKPPFKPFKPPFKPLKLQDSDALFIPKRDVSSLGSVIRSVVDNKAVEIAKYFHCA